MGHQDTTTSQEQLDNLILRVYVAAVGAACSALCFSLGGLGAALLT